MSKIKHWNEATQSWEIDGASNAANIELSNPGYLDENGDSISVDLGFTKLDNRMNKLERNLAWIYQNGAKGGSGGGGGGGGGGIDSTEYTIVVEEGSRVYTAGTSVTIHMTINGGSLRKIFLVEISNASTGERLASPVVTGLTRTEVTINGLSDSSQVLKISAHTGLYYASDYILTVVAGAIKLLRTRVTPALIYPTTIVSPPIFLVYNSTDSDLKIIVDYTTDQVNYHNLVLLDSERTNNTIMISEVSLFLQELALINIGETFRFKVYALGVLNDTLLQSNAIYFDTTITLPNTLYILTYGVNRSVPSSTLDLSVLNLFVYGQSVLFLYELSFSDNNYPIYNIEYEIAPCYFESGVLVTDIYQLISGEVIGVSKGTSSIFSFSTASLPNDTIYNPETNDYKFIKVTLKATSADDSRITDTKILYFTLSRAVEKYINATNFDKSLICYFSPVMGVPTGNINTWRYDNLNLRFPYSRQGIVLQRYIDLVGYNLNGIRNGFSTLGMHLTGKSYALLGLNLFSSQAHEVNLLNTNGFTISTTFRTDANIDSSSTVLSLGTYRNNILAAGIEIIASQVKVAVNAQLTTLNITKGDLVTIDIVLERYVGEGDAEDTPTHWFVKIYLNGVLSSLGSYENNLFTSTTLGTGWYFNDYLCLGARVDGNNVISSADVHFYDFKIYSTALSDNEITLNYVSSIIYSELDNGANPSLTLQTELLSKNFILINTEGEYESLLFNTDNPKEYKDDNTLLNTLRGALADSKIPYPIVVINLIVANSNFYGTTQAQFSEDLKAIVTGEEYRYPINMDYYTMGNTSATRIANADKMLISIQGTSSLQFVSKNYEIYLGSDEENKPVLVQMREDWLPENEYTLKADVMDSAHVNNVLIGRIINGMVTTIDASGQEVAIKPLENTPPMNINNTWASKIKHTSEGYPVILFINFRNSDNSTICKCQGIYNFNLGRAALFNLGLKSLNSCTFVDNSATFPRKVESYEESLEVITGSPVYSIEVGENNQLIGAFDQDDPNILSLGIFDVIYQSDGAATTHLLRLLTFLSNFGYNILNPKKRLINQLWCTPKIVKNGSAWEESGSYYYPANNADYVQSTLELHMNYNNLIAYYMIAIIFGLVDSMGKNLTLRTWNMTNDENGTPQCVWYMCFYDMDTAMRLDNDGNETIPYNAHLNRYYTDSSGSFSEVKVDYHTASIPGSFTLVYSSYNTRLLEIAENLKDVSKTLETIYVDLRNNLFPDPGTFIDLYYTGQINLIGAALYNYDYKLKYLQTKKLYSVLTGELVGTHDYNLISYLHGNGATNIKSWFKRRIRFLDGIYGANTDGTSTLNNSLLVDVTLNEMWSLNQVTKNLEDPSVIYLTLTAESLIFISFAAGAGAKTLLWINEYPATYKIRNVSGTQRLSVYGNKVITLFDGFNKFRWKNLDAIVFPLVKSLSLENLQDIAAEGFLSSLNVTDLQSLRELNLKNVKLIDNNSLILYKGLEFTNNLPSLEWLDISGSSFNDILLPLAGVLKHLDVSNTRIREIDFSGQPMLEDLIIDDCSELESIKLTNCPKIKSLTVPASVKTVELANCLGLLTLNMQYSGSSRYVSNLTKVSISACAGLKRVFLTNLNNDFLEINLAGAPNMEYLDLGRVVTTNIVFPAKSRWTTLKTLNLNGNNLGYLNYLQEDGVTLHTDYLDLELFEGLTDLILADNAVIRGIKCSQNALVNLGNSALSNCTGLLYIHGNFNINGTRVFQGCSLLHINDDSVYNTNPLLTYPVPFVNNPDVCNLRFDPNLESTQECFSGCASISGNDFTMIMLLLHSRITNMSKMFSNCVSIDATLRYDVFRHCPNVEYLTSFLENSGIQGGIYSRSDDYNSQDTQTYGTFDFIPNLKDASYAFAGSLLLYIDDNIFAPKNNKYNTIILNVDYMFSYCTNLHTYLKVNRTSLIPNGMLSSKTFFNNLRGTNGFPQYMFLGCRYVNMHIDSENIDGIQFDYLFHYYTDYNIRTLNSSIYAGINLVGEIHDNVFGGRLLTDGEYKIVNFTVIDAPFSNSGDLITCDLSSMGKMFNNLQTILTLAKGVLKGLSFTNSEIPVDIFSGCTVLNNIEGFFSNDKLTNNGNIYQFPQHLMFVDCVSLSNVSNLFLYAHNLNIQLIGDGFENCQLVKVNNMFQGSGVFGMIPFHLFYMQRNGVLQQTIDNISNVFLDCYKLGYTSDRTLSIGDIYLKNNVEYRTVWTDHVITNRGTRVPFLLDFTNFNGDDEWYIDGRDWKSINPNLAITDTYQRIDADVFKYDREQALALSDSRDREEGFLNYMFPADYFRYCSTECSMDNAFQGLTYTSNYILDDGNGLPQLVETLNYDGLVGRLPCKLFLANIGNLKFTNVFKGLQFCAFVNFNSYKLNTLLYPDTQCRGIKYPPDLLRNNVNLQDITGLFYGTYVESGVDINPDLTRYNTNLTIASNLFRNITFNSKKYYGSDEGTYSLIDFRMFTTNTELQDVSGLFAVDNYDDNIRGLHYIDLTLFGTNPETNNPYNPRLVDVSGCFLNNSRMLGTIPLMDTSLFTRITRYSNYVGGCIRTLITNANDFINLHSTGNWIPSTWIDE